MRISVSVVLLATLIFAAAAAQLALFVHVRDNDLETLPRLQQPLASLPLAVGDWRGADVPINEQLQFADDALQRVYRHGKTGQQVTLWIAYSSTAADRGHHPEVCMAVLGKPENRSQRALLPVEGHDRPVQVLNFGSPGEQTWAFYWHYAMSLENQAADSVVRRLYRGTRRLPPSVTLEVFAEDSSPAAQAGAVDFVRAIDKSIQPYLGDNPRRGNARLPVTIVAGQ